MQLQWSRNIRVTDASVREAGSHLQESRGFRPQKAPRHSIRLVLHIPGVQPADARNWPACSTGQFEELLDLSALRVTRAHHLPARAGDSSSEVRIVQKPR